MKRDQLRKRPIFEFYRDQFIFGSDEAALGSLMFFQTKIKVFSTKLRNQKFIENKILILNNV